MYPKGDLFIPASHGRLEAILKKPSGLPQGVALVCHPHPLGGGTMHNKVVFRAAAGLVDAGLITLKFNFRGVGLSTGVHNEIEGGIEDVRDARRIPDRRISRSRSHTCRIFVRFKDGNGSRGGRRTRNAADKHRHTGR